MNKDKPCESCGAGDNCSYHIGVNWENCWFPVGEVLVWVEVRLR
jgi:hypothetical protein